MDSYIRRETAYKAEIKTLEEKLAVRNTATDLSMEKLRGLTKQLQDRVVLLYGKKQDIEQGNNRNVSYVVRVQTSCEDQVSPTEARA